MASEGLEVLHDRRSEREVLERLLEGVRGGQSRVLVMAGEPGVGKTALLESAINSASGYRIIRAVGVESEMELAFAALHQLCVPMLDRLERLPVPQRDALEVAFGLRSGAAPDRFLVALAVLSLLSEVAQARPLLCVVDDAQWLDRASAQALVFVARRLLAESVGSWPDRPGWCSQPVSPTTSSPGFKRLWRGSAHGRTCPQTAGLPLDESWRETTASAVLIPEGAMSGGNLEKRRSSCPPRLPPRPPAAPDTTNE